MTTYQQVKQALNMGTTYEFEGKLFRDFKRNTGTLYIYITDPTVDSTTPEIRIGFDEFERSDSQRQTNCIIRQTGQTVEGIRATVFVPDQEVYHYQINITLGKELYVLHWHTEDGKNLVASSSASPIYFKELLEPRERIVTQLRDKTDSTKLRNFLRNIGE